MFKYGLAWMLGVPLSLLVVIYLIFRVLWFETRQELGQVHTACGREPAPCRSREGIRRRRCRAPPADAGRLVFSCSATGVRRGVRV